ncbi:hypothetical protein CHS0354_020486 [Potamilus streckersoni]|uniref:C1q domain-containing protein n=1 Tax=Potamilus streckersoni TaxID=2493646 RepID=A0AAE0W4J0_9BIVA|nr:hypothetical protein CHS0354_020486 [Potamilus streckersoni]
MACFSNVSGFILILLSYNCDVSSGNNYDKQLSKMEEELLNMMEIILNLRRDLNKERTERKENSEVLNRKISQCTCEIQDMNRLQNYIDNVTVRSDVSECVDNKKIKNLEKGLAKEKVLRIMTGNKVSSLEKELEKFRNLVENKLNEQSDHLKVQKAKVTSFENDISQANVNVGSLQTDINNMASVIGSIRSDIHSTKGDTGERLRNVEAKIKTVEGNVENINTALKTDAPKIAFHARVSSNLSQFSPGQTIIFDDVYINLGNGYLRNRGVFRVPIEGIYIILVTVSTDARSAPDYEVVRNGTPISRASIAANTDIFIGSSCNAILSLNVGDEIWAKTGYYRSTDKIRGLLFSTFSVGLISN